VTGEIRASHFRSAYVHQGMWTLFKEGGFAMFIVLAFGGVALCAAFWFALRPSERHVGFLKWMSKAILYSSIGGILVDFSTVTHYVAGAEDIASDMRTRIVLEGFGESMAPGIMGFTFLALVAMLAAVGQRRLDAQKSA